MADEGKDEVARLRIVDLGMTPADQERRQRCIRLLESALETARAGVGLKDVVLFARCADGDTFTSRTTADVVELVGALEILKADILHDFNHGDDEE